MLFWSISPEISPIDRALASNATNAKSFHPSAPQGLNFQKPTYDKRRPQNFPLV